MKGFKYIAILIVIILILGIFNSCSEKNQANDASVNSSDHTNMPPANISINDLLASMTLEEKAGQMVLGSRDVVLSKEIRKLGLGSVISGGGSSPGINRTTDWVDMITRYQDAAMKTDKRIPIIYGIDAVHGVGHLKDAVIFPHNIGLGAANDPKLMYEMGAAVAEEMKLIRVPWNFSPCVAVNTDPRWGRTYECYSSDPNIVTELAKAYVRGMTDHGIIATAKHYVADGAATFGSSYGNFLIDRGNAILTEEELRETHLMPYKELVDSGIKVIMASFSSWNGVMMHENKYLLTDVLKNEYSFKGFIVSDWEAVQYLEGDSYGDKIIKAVNTGIDMLMETNGYKDARSAIIKAVNKGQISEERVNDAVRRILTVKKDMGLFDDPYMEKVSNEVSELGSEKYRSVAKQLVEKSLVLLKNEDNILPLKSGQKLFVTGPIADDIGQQCGGWGLTWQGVKDTEEVKVTTGTTILEGLVEYGNKYGFEIITEETRAKEADAVILVIGEVPYAEYYGDTRDMSITGAKANKDNEGAIELTKTLGKPVITLIVAGRNVIISDYIDDWDSLVMCYLPGTEGDGIASVLSGEINFTGKLPMPYYKSVDDIGKEGARLLFDVGYGLGY